MRDADGEPMLPLYVHAKHFLAGLVSEFIISPDSAVKRLEIMRSAPTPGKIDDITRGFMCFIEEQEGRTSW